MRQASELKEYTILKIYGARYWPCENPSQARVWFRNLKIAKTDPNVDGRRGINLTWDEWGVEDPWFLNQFFQRDRLDMMDDVIHEMFFENYCKTIRVGDEWRIAFAPMFEDIKSVNGYYTKIPLTINHFIYDEGEHDLAFAKGCYVPMADLKFLVADDEKCTAYYEIERPGFPSGVYIGQWNTPLNECKRFHILNYTSANEPLSWTDIRERLINNAANGSIRILYADTAEAIDIITQSDFSDIEE